MHLKSLGGSIYVALSALVVSSLAAAVSSNFLLATAQTDDASQKNERSIQDAQTEWVESYQFLELALEMGLYEDAIPEAQRALLQSEKDFGIDHEATQMMVAMLGVLYKSSERYDEALAMYDRGIETAIRTLGLSSRNTAVGRYNIAQLYLSKEEYDLGASFLEEAISDFQPRDDRDSQLLYQIYKDLGEVHRTTGNFQAAERVLLTAIGEATNLLGEDASEAIDFKSELGLSYFYQGRLGSAEQILFEAWSQRHKKNGEFDLDTLIALDNLGLVYNAQGRFQKAEETHQNAYNGLVAVVGENHPHTMLAANNLAGVLLAGSQFERSISIYDTLVAESTAELGFDHPETLNAVANLASVYTEAGDWARGADLYEKVFTVQLETLGPDSPKTLYTLSNWAASLTKLGMLEDAASLYTALNLAMKQVYRDQDRPALIHQYNYGYFVKEKYGINSVPIMYLKQAVNGLQFARDDLSNSGKDARSSYLTENRRTYLSLQSLLISEGRFAEAELVGRMLKETEFFDFVGHDESLVSRMTRIPMTPYEVEWLSQLEKWDAQLIAETRHADDNRYDQLIQMYEAKISSWLESVEDNDANYSVRNRSSQIDDASARLFATLPAGTTLLQIVNFENKLNFLVTTKDGTEHFETSVSRSALNAAIFKVRSQLIGYDPNRSGRPTRVSEVEADGREALSTLRHLHSLLMPTELYEHLVGQDTDTLLLNLQGSLRYVPFSALYDGEKFLIEKFELALFTPAAGEEGYERRPLQLDGVGFGTTQAFPGYSALPGVRKELEFVMKGADEAGLIDGRVFFDQDFTESVFKRELGTNPNIVHMATHFEMKPGNDENSYLLLGDGSFLTLGDIRRSEELGFDGVSLLTLSACSTGLGSGISASIDRYKFGSGEEIEGLAVLAQSEGAESVLASLWNVSDSSTAELMTYFYQAYASGEHRKSEALQYAQLKLLEDPATSHPYYWAAFVLMGNWL